MMHFMSIQNELSRQPLNVDMKFCAITVSTRFYTGTPRP